MRNQTLVVPKVGTLIDCVLRIATGRRAAVAVAALAVGGGLLFRASPYDALKSRLGGASLPEEGVTPPDRLIELLQALGTDGRSLYLEFQAWDVLNPILIGLAGALLLGWLLNRTNKAKSNWRYAILLPVAALATDLLENLVISIAVRSFPEPSSVSSLLPLFTGAKFAAAIGTLLLVVLLLLFRLRDWLGRVPRRAT